MSYTKQNFKSGEVLMASQLNAMDEQIAANEIAIENKQSKGDYLTTSAASSMYQPKGTYLTKHQSIKTLNGQSLVGVGNIVIDSNDDSNAYLIPNPVDLSTYNGKKLVCIGDSVTAGVGATTNYVSRLGTALGLTVVNSGVSGTVLCTGGHRTCNIGKLTESNLGNADYVTILMGINDWDQARDGYYDLGDINTTDTTTIYGAVKMWCDRIMELKQTDALKDTKFYFMTPLITSWNNSVGSRSWDQNKVNIHGYKLRDLCEAIINVCDMYQIPVIDLNLHSGIYYNSAEDQNATQVGGDGIHPNDAGHELITNAIVKMFGINPTYATPLTTLHYVLQYISNITDADITYPIGDNVIMPTEIPLTNISLSNYTLELTEGDTFTVTATLEPADTTQTTIAWESSNTGVATVADGVITAIAEGNTTITCKSVANPSIKATIQLGVIASTSTELKSLVISDEYATANIGDTKTLTVTYVPSNTVETGVVWSVDDDTIASITPSADGKSCDVTALSAGQCYVTATSTVNDSIKATCFFTASEAGETPETPETSVDLLDASNYTLGSNARFNSETGEISGTASLSAGGTLQQTANAATFNIPLKAGMEVEVQHTFSSSNYSNFIGFGVDTTTDPSQIELGGGYPRGKFIVYYDVPSKGDAIETWEIATSTHTKLFTGVGANKSPRTATIGRDANGKLYVKHNGATVTELPDYDCIETANNSENLYVWFGGCDNVSTWKITYFGETRGSSTEPDTPDTPTEPTTSTWVLGANAVLNEDGSLTAKNNGTTYANIDNVAIYNVPLTAGMQVEVTESQVNNSWGSFRGWGVDTTNNIASLQLVNPYPQGKFNIYYDQSGDAVKSITQGTGNQYTLLSSGKNINPRKAIIRRDADGKITCSFNGVEMNMPSYSQAPYLSEAETAENLYVWIGGLSSDTTWTIDYMGPIRDYVAPEVPEDEPTIDPTDALYTW